LGGLGIFLGVLIPFTIAIDIISLTQRILALLLCELFRRLLLLHEALGREPSLERSHVPHLLQLLASFISHKACFGGKSENLQATLFIDYGGIGMLARLDRCRHGLVLLPAAQKSSA